MRAEVDSGSVFPALIRATGRLKGPVQRPPFYGGAPGEGEMAMSNRSPLEPSPLPDPTHRDVHACTAPSSQRATAGTRSIRRSPRGLPVPDRRRPAWVQIGDTQPTIPSFDRCGPAVK
ncbi:MAG TPA: hypothetical protein DDZ81_19795 [Acetobacteraceae bacterium]|jgi:hypothetical protein|nr:hypothetical protein [Acetobacteraceae bacterium]